MEKQFIFNDCGIRITDNTDLTINVNRTNTHMKKEAIVKIVVDNNFINFYDKNNKIYQLKYKDSIKHVNMINEIFTEFEFLNENRINDMTRKQLNNNALGCLTLIAIFIYPFALGGSLDFFVDEKYFITGVISLLFLGVSSVFAVTWFLLGRNNLLKGMQVFLYVAITLFVANAFIQQNVSVTNKTMTLKLDFGDRTGTYTGAVKEYLPNGYGKFYSQNEDGVGWEYVGYFENGHFVGEGETKWDNGYRVVGAFSNDYLNGLATRYNANEVVYEGELINGKTEQEDIISNYTFAMLLQIQLFSDSLNKFSIKTTEFGFDSYSLFDRTKIDEIQVILDGLIQTTNIVLEYDNDKVPDAFKDVHKDIKATFKKYKDAFSLIKKGLDSMDAETIASANVIMNEARSDLSKNTLKVDKIVESLQPDIKMISNFKY